MATSRKREYITQYLYVFTSPAYGQEIVAWLKTLPSSLLEELSDVLFSCDHGPVNSWYVEDWLEEYGGEREWYVRIYIEPEYKNREVAV